MGSQLASARGRAGQWDPSFDLSRADLVRTEWKPPDTLLGGPWPGLSRCAPGPSSPSGFTAARGAACKDGMAGRALPQEEGKATRRSSGKPRSPSPPPPCGCPGVQVRCFLRGDKIGPSPVEQSELTLLPSPLFSPSPPRLQEAQKHFRRRTWSYKGARKARQAQKAVRMKA